MRIGYPCQNLTLPVSSSKTFRLASYSDERFHETVTTNLTGLLEILKWNKENNIYFFRISSDLIPFASHPICTISWPEIYKETFMEIGRYIRQTNMRVSLHPDQFTLLNSPSEQIFENSVRELLYHVQILDNMELDSTHKIQIHVGGVYGDKEASSKRFIDRYKTLPEEITRRLVIENDERMYSVKDCVANSKQTGIPVLFDTLHHEINNNQEKFHEALTLVKQTWNEKRDGIPMIDYSSQDPNKRIGAHNPTIDLMHFQSIINIIPDQDIDIMLEIKDKEKSCLKALKLVQELN